MLPPKINEGAGSLDGAITMEASVEVSVKSERESSYEPSTDIGPKA